MKMGIRDIADKMYKVKRIEDEYVTKNEYKNYRKNKIMEEWENKQETFEERKSRLEKINPWKINKELENIDKKFCINTGEFVNNYGCKFSIMSFDDRSKIIKIGRDIICNFILERSDFLIRSNAVYIPNCEDEDDVKRWFEENCNNICLGIPMHSRRHIKFNIKGSGIYDGIDYICNFIGGVDNLHYRYCEDNHYRPFLNKYMDDKQRQIYGKFYELVDAQSILIELEYISSNFIRHKHPGIVDMIICYHKDKEVGIPVLELYKEKV